MPFLIAVLGCWLVSVGCLWGQTHQADKTDSLYQVFLKDYKNPDKIKKWLQLVSLERDPVVFFHTDLLLQRVITLCEHKQDYAFFLPEAVRSLGFFYINKHKYAQAFLHFKQAETIYKRNKDYNNLFYTWYYLAATFHSTKDTKNALHYARLAESYIPLIQQEKYTIDIINLANMQALEARQDKRYEDAITHFERGLRIAKEKNIENWIGLLHGNMGTVFLLQKQYEKALQAFEIDIRLSLKHQLYASALNAQSAKMDILLQRAQMHEAKMLRDSMQTLMQTKVKDTNSYLPAYQAFAKYHALQREYAQAFDYQQKITEMERGKAEHLRRQEVSKLQAQFEYEKQDRIIQEQNVEIENKILYYYLWASLSISLLVLLLVFVIFLLKMRFQQRIISRKNIQLKEVVEVQDKMFSIIGHDLRNPIGNLKAMLNLYNASVLTQEEFVSASQKLQQQVNTLYDTMNDLLMWASAQIQEQKNKPEEVYLVEPIDETISFYENIAQQKNIEVERTISSPAKFFVDKNQFKVILRNLLSNALKFTPTGGKIRFYTSEPMNTIQTLTIEDTGTGMTEEEVGKLFNLTTHFSRTGTHNEKGTGLGLLLVKEYVEANRGNLSVTSEKNKGTKFMITLPTEAG